MQCNSYVKKFFLMTFSKTPRHVLEGETTGHFQLQLASYIKPGISTYKKLEDAIFGDDDIATETITECIESEKTN